MLECACAKAWIFSSLVCECANAEVPVEPSSSLPARAWARAKVGGSRLPPRRWEKVFLYRVCSLGDGWARCSSAPRLAGMFCFGAAFLLAKARAEDEPHSPGRGFLLKLRGGVNSERERITYFCKPG